MKNVMLRTLVTLVAAASAAAQQPAREQLTELQKELIEVEAMLHQFQRAIPPESDLAAEQEWIRRFVEKEQLPPVELKTVGGAERFRTPEGDPLPVEIKRLQLSGRGSYSAIHFLLSMIRIRPRLVAIESVDVDAAPNGTVQFTATLTYPFWSDEVPADDRRADVLTAVRNRIARTRAIAGAIATFVRQANQPRSGALAAFTREAEDHAIALTSARIGDGVTMRGFFSGSAARAALEQALRDAQLQVAKLETASAGVCESFVISAMPAPRPDADDLFDSEFTVAADIFDEESAAFCGSGSQERPARINVGSISDDTLFLRLRDVAARDLFLVLNEILGEDFIVDEDVTGRVDVDVSTDAVLDDLITALGEAGLHTTGGPLRRVSRSRNPAPPASAKGAGEPVSLSFQDAGVSDILCLFSQMSGQPIKIAADRQQRVSVYANEVPLDVVTAALAPEAPADGVDACTVETRAKSRLWTHAARTPIVSIRDLRVAGIARSGDGWQAWAYGPGGVLRSIGPGSEFLDGRFESADPQAVMFRSAGGETVALRLTR